MSTINVHPNYVNSKTSGVDLSITGSVTSVSDSPTVTSNGNAISMRGDMALWDTGASAYVSIQNTSVGTTSSPKLGQ